MNSFLPALIAVLLAETGGRALVHMRLPRLSVADGVLAFMIAFAAAAGMVVAPTMTTNARALLLGSALVAVGAGQIGNRDVGAPPRDWWSLVRATLRTNVAFLVFAFAAWKADPVGAAAGGCAGFVGAVLLSAILPGNMLVVARVAASTTLGVTGVVLILWALRLIG